MTTPSSQAAPAPPEPFDAPWQLRTYVMATAMVEQRLLDRAELTDLAGDGLRAWVSAVQEALLANGVVSAGELEAEVARQVAVAAARNVH